MLQELNRPATAFGAPSHKPQASSLKLGPTTKLTKQQAASIKPGFQSVKLQAASSKRLDLLSLVKIRETRSEVLD